jgi:hypothetical protein
MWRLTLASAENRGIGIMAAGKALAARQGRYAAKRGEISGARD